MNLHWVAKLTKDGAESNQGLPGIIRNYVIQTVVQATYHQGNGKYRQYAGYAGKQCTSNAYFALTFFVTNNNYIWKAFRVDNILEQRYELLLYVYIDYIHVSVSKLAH